VRSGTDSDIIRFVNVAVVIPTLNRRESLAETLASLAAQTLRPRTFVVDNASSDGTAEMVATRFPDVTLVRNDENLGFGRAIDRVALSLDADVLVLVNNDVVCDPQFVERIVEPFAEAETAMVGGILLQQAAPNLIDSAGLELDPTLGAWDHLWNKPVESVAVGEAAPAGPCGGAAAYRLSAYKDLDGFDERLFAYWEDVDLAIRLRQAGFGCAVAPEARALHKHGMTLGPSTAQRALHAYGRGYVMAKFGVTRSPVRRLQAALLDWPTLLVHLVVRREREPIRARRRGLRDGAEFETASSPPKLPTITFREALRRQARFLRLRARRRLPRHFYGG
jgi:N-acetylglucosaminyl-diphospho-decaprenol L-rhamnosyltransferase